jgi:acetyl esterase/lipase
MKRECLLLGFVLMILEGIAPLVSGARAGDPEKIALWGGKAPIGDGSYEKTDVWATLYRPDQGNGALVVICPGGGYAMLAVEPEGHGIARWLNGHGIAGLVLEYRLPAGRCRVPLLDAQRAIRLARANAQQWDIDPSRIGIMGFSAGGHLASTAGTHFDNGHPRATDPIDRVGCRPNFLILIYPVITMGKAGHQGSKRNLLGDAPTDQLAEMFSNEKQVTDETPPAFLAHALDDEPVPVDNSRLFHQALRDRDVPSMLLELPSGGHGLNGYQGPMWEAWQRASLTWLAEQGFVKNGEGHRATDRR